MDTRKNSPPEPEPPREPEHREDSPQGQPLSGEALSQRQTIGEAAGSVATDAAGVEPADAFGAETYVDHEEEVVDVSGIVREIATGGTPFTLRQLRDLLGDYGIELDGKELLSAFGEAQATITAEDERLEARRTWVVLRRIHGYRVTHHAYAEVRGAKKAPPSSSIDRDSGSAHRQRAGLSSELAPGRALALPQGLYEDTGAADPRQELASAFLNQNPEAGMSEVDIVAALVRRSIHGKAEAEKRVRAAIDSGLLVRAGRRDKQKLFSLAEEQPEEPDVDMELETEDESTYAGPEFVAVRDAVIENLTGAVEARAHTLKQLRLAIAPDMHVSAFNPIVRQLQRLGILEIQTATTKGAARKSPRIAFTDDIRELLRGAGTIEEARQVLKELATSQDRPTDNTE